jgi:hypothetical protein
MKGFSLFLLNSSWQVAWCRFDFRRSGRWDTSVWEPQLNGTFALKGLHPDGQPVPTSSRSLLGPCGAVIPRRRSETLCSGFVQENLAPIRLLHRIGRNFAVAYIRTYHRMASGQSLRFPFCSPFRLRAAIQTAAKPAVRVRPSVLLRLPNNDKGRPKLRLGPFWFGRMVDHLQH